jgi:hypothetical protein
MNRVALLVTAALALVLTGLLLSHPERLLMGDPA